MAQQNQLHKQSATWQIYRPHQPENAVLSSCCKQIVKLREELKRRHEDRQSEEILSRANRIRKGVMGMFDRVAPKLGRGKLHKQFAVEIEQQAVCDAGEFQARYMKQRESKGR